MCVHDSMCYGHKKKMVNIRKSEKELQHLSEKLRDFQLKTPRVTTNAIASLKTTKKMLPLKIKKKPYVDTGPTLRTFWFQFLDLLLFFMTHLDGFWPSVKYNEQLDYTSKIKKSRKTSVSCSPIFIVLNFSTCPPPSVSLWYHCWRCVLLYRCQLFRPKS